VTRPGSYIQYEYNARDWITAVRNRTTGGAVRYDASYYYDDGGIWDNTGNPRRRIESFGGPNYTTTLRYDGVYRQIEETKRNSGGVVQYSLLYGYDEVGNRTTRTLGGVTTTYTYDDNDKLTRAVRGAQFTNFYYDANGNMTSHTGPLYGTKTMVYNDENRLTSVTYSGVTDTYNYNWQGLRTSAFLGGSSKLYLYDGQRVYQERLGPNVTATYMTEGGSYFGSLLHLQRATGESRFPMYDLTGSARGLVDANGAVTDTYEMDTFGKPVSTTGSTPNPYRFGGAWGYMTDPSGFLQLGARYYWPEVGRFVQGDPLRLPGNRYAYVWNNPVLWIDPPGWWGTGIGVSGSAEGGGWDLGAGATGATGTGVFWGGPQGVNVGAWADAGGYAGTTTEGLAYPKTGAPHAAAGAYAGIGGMVWFTNAKSVQDLAGPFHNINVNVGVGPFKCSVQFAWSGGVRMVSVGPPFLGLGGGVSVSTYDTCAVVVP